MIGRVGKMEENCELEEGEACTYNKDDDDNNIDPEVALSYIDEKIQHILGHFQKDFEGGVSAENLGAKFGGYGSFLPAYERSPSIFSRPKTPENCSSTPKSPSHFRVEGVKQSLMVPSRSAPSVRTNVSHDSGSAVRTFSVKQESGLSAAPVAQNSTLKDKNLNKPSNLSDHRPLKVRIKVGPDKTVRTNAAIYCGLGLDNSPSSSLGNSLDESGGMLPVAEILADESPASIFQVMASFPIPGGVPISPLQESLLCLVRKERLPGDGKPVQANQEHSSLLAHESAAVLGNLKFSKEEVKPLERSRNVVELRKVPDKNFDNVAELPVMKNLETDGLDGKNIPSNNLKKKDLSNREYNTGSVKASGGPSEVSREASEDGMRERFSSSEMWKEDLSESKSGQGSVRSERRKARSSSVEKLLKGRALTSNEDVIVEPKGSGKGKSAKLSTPSKAYSNLFNWKEDSNAEPLVSSEEKVGEQTSFWVQDQFTMPLGNNKPLLLGKKKLKGIENNKREVDVSTIGRSSRDASKSSAKRQKLNSHKDINKVVDNKSSAKRLIGHREMDTSIDDDLEMGQLADLQKSNGRFRGKGVDNQQLQAGSCVPQDALASEVVPATGVLINESWVLCDKCEQWRLLPYGTTPDDLPEKWLCSMLSWLPGLNRCDISEEETTKALHALYQTPVDFVQNNMHNNGNATVSGVTSLHGLHPGHNHHGLSSYAPSSRENRRDVVNETGNAGTSPGLVHSSKNHSQESVKSKSINEVNQPPVEPNPVKKSGFVYKSKSHILDAEKHTAKHKECHINGGAEAKQMKIKSKREADHYGSKTPKRAKKEDIDHTFKQGNPDMDFGSASLSSKCASLKQAGGKNMHNSINYAFSENVECDTKERLLVSMQKVAEEALILSDGVSLDVRIGDKREKKRKLKEWQENQIGNESDEIGTKKERKSRVSKSVMKESSMDGACDKMSNKVTAGEILFPGGNHHIVDGTEDFRDMAEDKPSMKHRKKSMLQQTLQGAYSLRKDSGAPHVSLPATSSSSKVSGSLKARPTLDEVKGSPVESVSSSPLRPWVPEKLTSAGLDSVGKDGSGIGAPVDDRQRSCWDGEGGRETNRMVSISGGHHSEFLKCFQSDYRGGEVNQKVGRKSKPFAGDTEMPEHCHGNCRVERTHEIISRSDFCMDKKKDSDPVDENGDMHLKKKCRCVLETDSKSHVASDKRPHIVKHNVPDMSCPKSSKGEKDCTHSGVSVGCLMDVKLGNQVKLESHNDSDAKIVVLCQNKYNTSVQQNLNKDYEGKIKGEGMGQETQSGMLDLQSRSEVLGKQENGRTGAGLQRGEAFDGDNHDLVNARHPENVGSKSRARQSLGHCAPGLGDNRDLNAPGPARMNSFNQTAADFLKEAKMLRDRADHFKDSGFGFESNEVYFQAALKFLQGAYLLESCSSEISRKGEMTQLQVYNTTAKLCECCAIEYERRQDMAAAALAYKCVEVAYWRVVYCKNSSSSRDRNELQASLQLVPQGDSPSSSASDVDNLNNQGTIDKVIVTKGAVSHVAGNHAIAARNHLHFLRLLDFTQDVNFAMEALRKSQSAFLVADVAAEKAQNRECLSSVKKVIDFNFRDIEGLINLVELAMKSVSRSGLGGVKG